MAARLTPAQFHILREKGTERPGSSALLKEHRNGTFVCAADGNPLFSSRTQVRKPAPDGRASTSRCHMA
jgi:peptide methionine sulfoxide reductase MsrB